jgi:anti-sigma B factor antagonist
MRYNVTVTEHAPALHVDEVPTDGGATVLAVHGELDLATIDVLKRAVTGYFGRTGYIVLELSEMTFCDSTGLGTFVGLHRGAQAGGCRLSLAAPRRRVDDLLRLSGIDQVIPVYPSRHEALAASA